jgi:hypothetical protein
MTCSISACWLVRWVVGLQFHVSAAQIVHLHQVDLSAQSPERSFHAFPAFRLVFTVGLGGHEHLVAQLHLAQQVAEDLFRVTVVRRGVEQLATHPVKNFQRLAERRHRRGSRFTAEIDRAYSHGGNLLSGRRNGRLD